MQCVIIAAGRGTRMGELTETLPKPLIEVCGRPILEHIVSALPEEITELVLVVGYHSEQIRGYCGDTFLGRPVTYVEQEDPKAGTGAAVFAAKDVLKDRFLVMYGDDIHGPEALRAAVQRAHCMLAATSDHPQDFGVLELNDNGTLARIIEKPADPPSNLVNIGGFVLNRDLFSYNLAKSEAFDEFLLTDLLTPYARDHSVVVVEQNLWIPVGRPEDIERAESMLCSKEKKN